ncbi:hypothetical protein B0H34DRAFT_807989 [Crassisporium funariophilum]|nr:hypothetical protein B0H34DRAFT_807989 [Crassisporium funariophilum]
MSQHWTWEFFTTDGKMYGNNNSNKNVWCTARPNYHCTLLQEPLPRAWPLMMTYLPLPLSQSPPPPVLPTITIHPSSTHLLARVTTVQKITIPLEKPLKYRTKFNHEEVSVQAMKYFWNGGIEN